MWQALKLFILKRRLRGIEAALQLERAKFLLGLEELRALAEEVGVTDDLHVLEKIAALEEFGRDLRNFGLPQPDPDRPEHQPPAPAVPEV